MGTFHSCDNYWMDWNFNILYLGTYHCCCSSTRTLLGILGANTFSWESWQRIEYCKILGLNVKIKTAVSNLFANNHHNIVKWEDKGPKSDKYRVWLSRQNPKKLTLVFSNWTIQKANNSNQHQLGIALLTTVWGLKLRTPRHCHEFCSYANGTVIRYSF